jgi:hypothetical protein
VSLALSGYDSIEFHSALRSGGAADEVSMGLPGGQRKQLTDAV